MRDWLALREVEPDDAVQYGVKGMKWGVRRDLKKMSPGDRPKYLQDRESKLIGRLDDPRRLGRAIRIGARDSQKIIKELNREYKDLGVNLKKDRVSRAAYDARVTEAVESSMNRAAEKAFGKSKTGAYKVRIVRTEDGQVKPALLLRTDPKVLKQINALQRSDDRKAKAAAKAELKHADPITEDDWLEFPLTEDDEGFIIDIGGMDEIEHGDLLHYGVLGMKWGVRRSDAELASAAKSRKASGEKVTPTKKETSSDSPGVKAMTGEETSSARYARLQAESKRGSASDWTDADLKFFNSRTEALAKVAKLNETNPSWLSKTSKKVLQQAAQNTMQSIADGVAKKYISTPILDSLSAAAEKKK